MSKIRLLIADDHPVFRFGLKALLEQEADIEIIAEAEHGKEVVELANDLKPDVVLMDITMPRLNGIEATKQIVEQHPEIGVLMITMVDDTSLFAALRAGARGYLLKGAHGDVTLRAIRAVANGEIIFDEAIADRILTYFGKSASPIEEWFPELTPREQEIFGLIAQGLTNDAIAERLSLQPKTVRNQVSTIFNKLEVANRGEAIQKARDAGLD